MHQNYCYSPFNLDNKMLMLLSSHYHICFFCVLCAKAGSMLDGVVDVGMLEVGEVQVVPFMAETKFNRPFFRNGIVVAWSKLCP